MREQLLTMRFAGAAWTIGFSPAVLEFLEARRTPSAEAFERAGQLFTGDLTSDAIVIDAATDLQPVSASARSFRLDIGEAERQRVLMLQQSRHFVGTWHTHFQSRPLASCVDVEFCRNHALAASSFLRGCLLVIVGTADFPEGLLLGAHDGKIWREASVAAQVAARASAELST